MGPPELFWWRSDSESGFKGPDCTDACFSNGFDKDLVESDNDVASGSSDTSLDARLDQARVVSLRNVSAETHHSVISSSVDAPPDVYPGGACKLDSVEQSLSDTRDGAGELICPACDCDTERLVAGHDVSCDTCRDPIGKKDECAVCNQCFHLSCHNCVQQLRRGADGATDNGCGDKITELMTVVAAEADPITALTAFVQALPGASAVASVKTSVSSLASIAGNGS